MDVRVRQESHLEESPGSSWQVKRRCVLWWTSQDPGARARGTASGLDSLSPKKEGEALQRLCLVFPKLKERGSSYFIKWSHQAG